MIHNKRMKIHIAGDYHGQKLLEYIEQCLVDEGHEVVNHGCTAAEAKASEYGRKDGTCDAATIAKKALKHFKVGDRGVLICGSGIAMSVVANKHTGVRAARIMTGGEAQYGVEHDGLNVICLAEHQLNKEQAVNIIQRFIVAEEDNVPRHKRQRQALRDLESDT